MGANTGGLRYSFVVPMQSCGTSASTQQEQSGKVLSNIIVIQNDAVVQEIWDSAQKISCQWTDRVTKTVSVRPLTIDMLETSESRLAKAKDDEEGIDVWMDLQQGRWPSTTPIGDSAVRIGEQLTLMIGLNDPEGKMDLLVRDCYAHSTLDPADPSAFRVQLTDFEGCVIKTKLLGPFQHQRPTEGSKYAGSTLKTSLLSAFSFPDNVQVFTSCNVEVCKGGCDSSLCQPTSEKPLNKEEPAVSTTTFQTPTISTATIMAVEFTTPKEPALILPSLEYLPPFAAETISIPSLDYLPPIRKEARSLVYPPSVIVPTTTLEPPPYTSSLNEKCSSGSCERSPKELILEDDNITSTTITVTDVETEETSTYPASTTESSTTENLTIETTTQSLHMFHFQRGDGRRGGRKIPLSNRTGRSKVVIKREAAVADQSEYAQVRLTRSIRVLPAASVDPAVIPSSYFEENKTNTRRSNKEENKFCISVTVMAASSCAVCTLLVGMTVIVVTVSVKYYAARQQLDKLYSTRR